MPSAYNPTEVNYVASGVSTAQGNQFQSLKYTETSYPSRSLDFLSEVSDLGLGDLNAKSGGFGGTQNASLKLNILVVGAGLGGLGTAIALRQKGFDVRVFEQAPALAEIGAGIQIPPNSGRLLKQWGVMDLLRKQAVQPDGITFRRWESGAAIAFTNLDKDFANTYGSPYLVVHRAHYHAALHERATELGVEISLNSRVVDYDAQRSAITLSNGQTFTGDLIIAADGVKSVARDAVGAGSRGDPKPTGYAAYRATVDVDKMMAVPELRWILEKPGLNVWIGHGRHVMSYTIASGRSFNLVLSHPDNSDHTERHNMTQEEVIRDMRTHFANWDPQLLTIIGLITHSLKWPLLGGSRLDSWTASGGRLAIIGDAAHAMLPYMSQGAAMAIEDGAGLAVILSKIRSLDELPFAMRVFERERKQRTGWMQEASAVNAMIWHFQDGPLQEARDEAMRAEVEGRRSLSSPNQWTDPVTQEWAYGYDAQQSMEKAWEDAMHDLIQKSS